MHLRVELADEGQVSRRGIFRKAFEVEREAVIGGQRSEEAENLLAQRGAITRILEHVAGLGLPGLRSGIEIVQVRKDLGVFLGLLDGVLDAVQLIRVVHCGAVYHGILAMAVVLCGQQRGTGRVHVQPIGIEQVDLVNVLLERGVAGLVVRHVEGRAQALAGVQFDLGRLEVALAPRRARRPDRVRHQRAVGQGAIVMLGNGQQQLRQRLATQHVKQEANHDQRGKQGYRVQDAAQPFPALAVGIVKNLPVGHVESSLRRLRENRGDGLRLYSTNRMEAVTESQLPPAPPSSPPPRTSRAALAAGLPLVLGLALRIYALKNLFEVNGDSLIYGGIAKNVLLHGRYALTTQSGEMYSTLIRLPGYPLLLAACFRLFSMEDYFSACCVGIVLDLIGCLLLAGFVRRIVPEPYRTGAAAVTLWLAALCPFTASYTAFPLTETPTLFMLALALWSMARFRDQPGWKNALWFTFAVCGAALLRPDGALAAVAFAPALVLGLPRERIAPAKLRSIALVCILLALVPFAVWTGRNWRTFPVIEPLAPRLAVDPGEDPNLGWERWVKTWCVDYISTNQVYWNVP